MKFEKITTNRLYITEFDESMAFAVHQNSLDEDNQRFVPDEVFIHEKDARDTILFLMDCYKGDTGPFVYPILLKNGENIGYVQAIPIDESWEIGYHIAKPYTNQGYATEALLAFIPIMMQKLKINQIWGICDSENIASIKVLKKCSFKYVKEVSRIKDQKEIQIKKFLYTKSDK